MDAGFSRGRHEVGVAGPAWDDMDVEVSRDAGSGSCSEVDPDVEAMGVERFF